MRLSLLWLAALAFCSGQVVVRVTNAADPANLVVAPGSWMLISGANLGPATAVRATPPFATTLGPYGVIVRNAAGDESRAFMVSVSGNVTVAILPSTLTAGEHELVYVNGTIRSRPLRFRVAERSFGIFTFAGDGGGPAEARVGDKFIGFLQPAAPGQVVVLRGTGLGAAPAADQQASEQPIAADIELRIGKAVVKPDYAGRSATNAGIDELRFTMPTDEEVGVGCYVPVRVKVDGAWSNIVTIAKTNSGEKCEHPLGLSDAALKKIDEGQTLVQGSFSLSSAVLDADIDGDVTTGRIETANGMFFLGTGNHLLRAGGQAGPIGLLPGECHTATAVLSESDLESIEDLLYPVLTGTTFRAPVPVDGGARAILRSPSGQQALLTTSFDAPAGTLQAILADSEGVAAPRAIAPGEWQVQWQGGSQLATGTAKLTVTEADPLEWPQALPVLETEQELALNWTTRGLDERNSLSLSGVFLAPASDTTIAFGSLTCQVPAAATSFTLPAAVLQAMPKTPAGGLALLVLEGRTAVTPFSASFRVGEGQLDYGAFDQRFAVVKLREYRR